MMKEYYIDKYELWNVPGDRKTKVHLALDVEEERAAHEAELDMYVFELTAYKAELAKKDAEIAQRDGYIKTLSDLALEHNNEIARLREALEYYIRTEIYSFHWTSGYNQEMEILVDRGKVAREALEQKSS